ncbi:MAG TPA: cytochrome b5 domain-containing protein [Verrucomicrobiae bacterium]|nr:cytochrome b5 domain-containing protein [Verrucomicrobiae bacterium]
MPKSRKLTLASSIVAVALIGGAVYLRASSAQQHPQTKATTTTTEKKPEPKAFTPQELAANDGKQDHKCYVAIEGKVYEIDQGRLWKNGEHVTSQGQAHCGLDLTEAIKKSPHGKSKLQGLSEIGTLQHKK